MNKDGVIKFNNHWIRQALAGFEIFGPMNTWRTRLYEMGLIGVTEEGIGYGNISTRFGHDQFIVTGSGTGNLKTLSGEHYALVTAYNIEANSLTAMGMVPASSESLTHAAIYQADPGIGAVIHVHHLGLWQHFVHQLPTSDPAVEYGTPAMADEIGRLFANTALPVKKILIMGGHREGAITFGATLDEAGQVLIQYLNLYSPGFSGK